MSEECQHVIEGTYSRDDWCWDECLACGRKSGYHWIRWGRLGHAGPWP